MSGEHTFYVFKRGKELVEDVYHNGTCSWIKTFRKKGQKFYRTNDESKAKYYYKKGELRERRYCKYCMPKDIPVEKTPTRPSTTKVNERIPKGSKFYASFNDLFYHKSKNCSLLKQQAKDGAIYGFVDENKAASQDTDHERTLDHQRIKCPDCFKSGSASKAKPKAKPKPKPKPKPRKAVRKTGGSGKSR